MRTAEAKRYARLLFGCFRTGDANDPEVYISAVVAVLSNYPVEIMRSVCDPVKGLPSEVKWLPTIAEVVDACQKLQAYDLRMAERQRRIDAQLKDRRQIPNWAQSPKAGGKTITWQEAEELMAADRKTKVLGVFDKDKTIPYRG